MEREYDFFVTTENPQRPRGAERGMIRRLVMRNFFETREAGVQANKLEYSSENTVMAKEKLKNRFRLPKSGKENIGPQRRKINVKVQGDKRRKKRSSVPATDPNKTVVPLGNKMTRRDSLLGETSGISDIQRTKATANGPGLMIDPSADRIDPFDVLPVPGTPQLDTLFRLYKGAPKNNPIAIDAKHTWRSFIMNDAGLLHATLASWALYGTLVKGLSKMRICLLKHKTEAIQAINCKISESGGFVSDEVVGTVLTLASFENLYGAYDVSRVHLVALRRMVDARGGLSAFGHNDGLLRGILWVDFHSATVFRTAPYFPRVCLDPDAPPLPDEMMEEAAWTSPTSLLQLSLSAIDCFNIFYRLHRLALATTSRWSGRVSRLTLSKLLYETQLTILSVPDRTHEFLDFDQTVEGCNSDGNGFQKHRADSASVVEALLAATLIFVYAALRGLPPNAKIFAILLRRLRVAFDRPRVSIFDIWNGEKNLKTLLWVLVVACSVASGADRAWWLANLLAHCRTMGVRQRDELESVMRCIAWTDVFFDGEMDRIWAELIRLQQMGLNSEEATQALANTVDQTLLVTQTWDKNLGWNYQGKGYCAVVSFEEGKWKVDGWYI